MQCSARKFLASQALYGAQIAHPDWSHDQLVDEAVNLSEKLIRRLETASVKIRNPKSKP
jgi:hypothetical protein